VADSFHKQHYAGYFPLLDVSVISQTIKNDTVIIESVVFSSYRDSVVGIATGYRLDDRGVGVQVPVGSRILSSPRRPERLWVPPDLLCNGYGASFPGGKAAGA
jgi:hypothetical protein